MTRPLRIGLVASRLHREGGGATLERLLRPLEHAIARELRAELFVVGRTFAAIEDAGLLAGYAGLHRLPDRREGGVMRLVAKLVDDDERRGLDAIVYLLDPDDPTSLFPEGLALKRQCVVHGRPFVSTFAHAREWFELERVLAGFAPDPAADDRFDAGTSAIALVAHDARKQAMEDFAREHLALLSSFAHRYATGTTGGRLNALAATLGAGDDWTERLKSGPLGGDAQLAGLVLDRRLPRVIFFEDPHVARQHEADIQLLERAARIATDATTCINDPVAAARWAHGWNLRAAARMR